jgi:hypothetical protein
MMSGQLQVPAALSPKKQTPGTHWIGGWVGSGAGLDGINTIEGKTFTECHLFYLTTMFQVQKFMSPNNTEHDHEW